MKTFIVKRSYTLREDKPSAYVCYVSYPMDASGMEMTDTRIEEAYVFNTSDGGYPSMMYKRGDTLISAEIKGNDRTGDYSYVEEIIPFAEENNYCI